MKGFTKISLLFASILVLIAGFFVSQKVFATQQHFQVTICHATGSQNNPYNKITVDDDAVDGQGNSDHNRSSHQNGEDIIPPGFWDFNGRNWTQQGQAIWNNNCNIPVSPTPTPTNTPTPTVTPTVTPDDACQDVEGIQESKEECEEPTPTPTEEPRVTPTPTEKQGDQPTFAGSSTNAPGVCADNPAIQKVANWEVVTGTPNDGKLTLNWALILGADEVVIYYGVNEKEPQHSVIVKNNGSYTIGELKNGQHYWFAIAGKTGCDQGELSQWLDPLP